MNSRLLWSVAAGLIFTVAIGVLVTWVLLAGDKAARDSSAQFATALVAGDPASAPKGSGRYLRGVRSHFGEIKSARVVDTRNHRTGSGNNARTYHLADVFLQTAKGPAVVELEFDGIGPLSKDITGVQELAPRDVPDHVLSHAEFTALAKAFDRRGGYPANELTFTKPAMPVPDKIKALPSEVRAAAVTPSPEVRKAQRMLKCVQKAKGDVEKMAACSR